MQTSCYNSLDDLLDDIGYEGFNSSFARQYLDTDAIEDTAREIYEDDVRNNPESFFNEEDRMLSNEQEEKIELLNRKIERLESHIEELEEQMDGENDDDIQEKVDELTTVVEGVTEEIEEIESSPEGEFPEDMIDEKIEELVSDATNDAEDFLTNWGLDWNNYIDKREFIEGVIDADGYGHTLNSYDGSADETYIKDTLFYVMRID
jgi:predicted ribosome quality control (RQC) complex YloA/Tae2 family protein